MKFNQPFAVSTLNIKTKNYKDQFPVQKLRYKIEVVELWTD